MGSIVTFYSFKGGVGRTMALANIAYLLAVELGRRVLAVDWDLEAPGLHRYFLECPESSFEPAREGNGLIDLMIQATKLPKPHWRDYVSRIAIKKQTTLSLITSGRQDDDYPSKVLGFDWRAFFAKSQGGAFIEELREEWRREFDIVLIDSRTGITDSSGICTIQMPDILVPVFTTTEESVQGVLNVVDRAQRARQQLAYDRARLLIFPLPSRYDGRTQYKEARAWLERFAQLLAPYYQDWLPRDIDPLHIIERTKLPYVGYFSFGTKMPVVIEGTSDPEGLGYAYLAAAKLIATDFQAVREIMPATIADKANQPTPEELALFRMRRALAEEKYEWRTIGVLAARAGISEPEAMDVLRADPEIEFSRSQKGKTIVKLRIPTNGG